MNFTNFNLNFSNKTLKVMALVLSVIGLIFIILGKYLGNFAIRAAMIVVLVVSILNLQSTYRYAGTLKIITSALTIIAAIVVFIFPSLIVTIGGVFLLYISVMSAIKIIKNKSYDDKVKIVLSVLGIIMSIVLIVNARKVVGFVIRIVGALFVAFGFVCFYKYMKNKDNDNVTISSNDKFKFENAQEIHEVHDIDEDN